MPADLTTDQQLRFRIMALESLVYSLLEKAGVDENTLEQWNKGKIEVNFDVDDVLNGTIAIQTELKK
ncbi:MAG: hypothetical protein HN578_08380 [Rhodospirillales bacterium]|nr:hypothetical protein [Rhodospirillales bacterium]MBT8002920.1 hypothetical protein [Rhodospirillales bacterium]